MVDVFKKKKIIGCKNFSTFFSEIIAPKSWFLDRINSVLQARIAIVFAEFPIGHSCVTTDIFNCSYSMNFTVAFKAQPLGFQKSSIIWKIPWFLTW